MGFLYFHISSAGLRLTPSRRQQCLCVWMGKKILKKNCKHMIKVTPLMNMLVHVLFG